MTARNVFLPVAGDSLLSCRTYGDKGIYKLCLDSFHEGDYETATCWLRMLENFIIRDFVKNDTGNRYTDFRKIPFMWDPGYNRDPDWDQKMGIPDSVEELAAFYQAGRFADTEISDIRITYIPARPQTTDSEGKVVPPTAASFIMNPPNGLGVEEAKEKITRFLSGISHKSWQKSVSFPG